jgi:hypothetical protein
LSVDTTIEEESLRRSTTKAVIDNEDENPAATQRHAEWSGDVESFSEEKQYPLIT